MRRAATSEPAAPPDGTAGHRQHFHMRVEQASLGKVWCCAPGTQLKGSDPEPDRARFGRRSGL